MSRYELSLSTSYVPAWGVAEGVRELIQNAIDEETLNPEHKMEVSYEGDTLYISNRGASLDIRTLLFGTSSKQSDNRMIGKHGEGYKVALLVLLRSGLDVTIYNLSDNTIWRPKLIKSKKYKGETVLVVDTQIADLMQQLKMQRDNASLYFKIERVTEEDYAQIMTNTLQLQGEYEHIDSGVGEVLIEEQHKGKIFVKGLYIFEHEKLAYGYNFRPEDVQLDRDRKLIGDYNLIWACSRVLARVHMDDARDFIINATHLYEGEYIDYYLQYERADNIRNLADEMSDEFFAKHGSKAIAVDNQNDFNKYLAKGLKPIMVSTGHSRLLGRSGCYNSSVDRAKESVRTVKCNDSSLSGRERLRAFLEEFKDHLDDHEDPLYDWLDNIADQLDEEYESMTDTFAEQMNAMQEIIDNLQTEMEGVTDGTE